MLLGSDLDDMSDAQLAKAAETTEVFAKLTPDQKARVVSVLRENGHTVGFMGDGINDAAAMKAADIGISVDTASRCGKRIRRYYFVGKRSDGSGRRNHRRT